MYENRYINQNYGKKRNIVGIPTMPIMMGILLGASFDQKSLTVHLRCFWRNLSNRP